MYKNSLIEHFCRVLHYFYPLIQLIDTTISSLDQHLTKYDLNFDLQFFQQMQSVINCLHFGKRNDKKHLNSLI